VHLRCCGDDLIGRLGTYDEQPAGFDPATNQRPDITDKPQGCGVVLRSTHRSDEDDIARSARSLLVVRTRRVNDRRNNHYLRDPGWKHGSVLLTENSDSVCTIQDLR